MADLTAAIQPEEDVLGAIARHLRADDITAALKLAEAEIASLSTVGGVAALSAIAFRQGDIATSIKLLETIGDNFEGESDVPETLAVLNCLAGRVSEALFYGKLATLNKPDGLLIPLYGPSFPDYSSAFLNMEHKPLLVRSREALNNGFYAEAIRGVEQHLQLFQDDVEALDHHALCLSSAGEHHKAAAILRSVITLAGHSATLFSRLGQALVALGSFDQGVACHRQAVTRGPKAAALWAAMIRDWAYYPWKGGLAFNDATADFARVVKEGGPKVSRQPPVARENPVLVVGFLCNAPHGDDLRQMISAVAGAFDRSRVKVVGFGSGELDSAVNNAYRGSFDVWRNTQKVDELTLSAMIRGEGVDVLIDTDGLAARERLSLLLRNAAPLQYSWLNVPAGVSMPGAGSNLAWGESSVAGLLLPRGQGDGTPLPASQADGVITFGADVTLAELNAELVRVWGMILQAVPESVLVLADRGFQVPEASTRLVEMFGDFGVAHRIDVMASPSREDFFRNVDVALAPFPVLNPSVYGVALGGGVPVVTLRQNDSTGFASTLATLEKVGGSMLAEDVSGYVALAVEWASNTEKLAAFREGASQSFLNAAAFDPAVFASRWEILFRERIAALAAANLQARA